MQKRFQKKEEDFTCEKCGFNMKGTGYTNHCQECLWSKHVDVNPGDRVEKCKGLMEPIKTKILKGEYVILHKCSVCGYTKRNKASKNDNMKKIIELSSF